VIFSECYCRVFGRSRIVELFCSANNCSHLFLRVLSNPRWRRVCCKRKSHTCLQNRGSYCSFFLSTAVDWLRLWIESRDVPEECCCSRRPGRRWCTRADTHSSIVRRKRHVAAGPNTTEWSVSSPTNCTVCYLLVCPVKSFMTLMW
jgi:hypothetical protein